MKKIWDHIKGDIVVICGPTASGKTFIAHEIAKKYNAEIVNADSMQIYQELPIITASPSQELKTELPYHLYNFLSVDQNFSAIKYCALASDVINDIISRNKMPILVGGSGMYIKMLLEGYSAMPDICEEVRAQSRSDYNLLGVEKFYQILCEMDPKVQSVIKPNDMQRAMRAYEVFIQTGMSILDWQKQPAVSLLSDIKCSILYLHPSRELLYRNCNERLIELFASGAVEEVQKMRADFVGLATPAMKALGVPEIGRYLAGEITRDLAVELASAKTRQYAKRQCTWFRHQMPGKYEIHFSANEELKAAAKVG
jgi:tRNA dimethylallyltransferase